MVEEQYLITVVNDTLSDLQQLKCIDIFNIYLLQLAIIGSCFTKMIEFFTRKELPGQKKFFFFFFFF